MGFSTKIIGMNDWAIFSLFGMIRLPMRQPKYCIMKPLVTIFVGAVIPRIFQQRIGERWQVTENFHFFVHLFWHGPTFAGATSIQLVGQTGQRSVRTCQTQSLLPHLHPTPFFRKLESCRNLWCFFNQLISKSPTFPGELEGKPWKLRLRLWWTKWVCRGEIEGLGAGARSGWNCVGWLQLTDGQMVGWNLDI